MLGALLLVGAQLGDEAPVLGGVGAEAKDAVAPLTEQSQSLDDIRSLEAVRALSKIIPDQP